MAGQFDLISLTVSTFGAYSLCYISTRLALSEILKEMKSFAMMEISTYVLVITTKFVHYFTFSAMKVKSNSLFRFERRTFGDHYFRDFLQKL